MIVDELVTVLGLEIRDTGLSNFRSSLTATSGRLGLVVAGAVSAAAAIAGMAASLSVDASKQAKFARSLGISTQELQQLEFAAKKAGISAEGLDSIVASLAMNLGSAKTADGVGFLQELGMLGLSAFDDGKTKGEVPLLMELADAYAGAADKATAFHYISKILGDDPRLKNLFEGGSAGIRAMMGGATTFSDAEMGRFEAFADKLDEFLMAWQKLVAELGTPMLGAATGGMEELLQYSRSDGFATLKGDIGEIAGLLGEAADKASLFYKELAQGMPEGSAGAALLATAAIMFARRHPVVATVVGAGYMGQDIKDTAAGKEGTFTPEILPGFGNKIDQLLDLHASLMNSTFGIEIPKSDIEGRARQAQTQAANVGRFLIENMTVNVKSPQDGGVVLDEIESELNKAAERGSTGVLK